MDQDKDMEDFIILDKAEKTDLIRKKRRIAEKDLGDACTPQQLLEAHHIFSLDKELRESEKKRKQTTIVIESKLFEKTSPSNDKFLETDNPKRLQSICYRTPVHCMSITAGQKPTRKFPAPCWTRDEALSLIEAYRERWHALHRAFLRTTDWDAVAEKVNDAFPDVMPLKTSAQCRHKIEKLRQRHRAEQQRAAAFSGEKFFSNWFYFEAMEALDNGYVSEPGDQMVVNLKTRNNNGSNPGRGIRFKPSEAQKLAILPAKSSRKQNPNLISRVSNRINNGSLIKTPIQENPKKQNIRSKVTVKTGVQEPVSNEPGRPGLRPRKFSKVLCDDDDNEDVEDGEMWFKVPRRKNVARGEYRNEKYSVPNGKDVKKGNVKGKGKKNGGMSEVVASIKLLGDGFMKAEMMKIDMAREIEKMRMESEMKRSRLLLESQRQIVDAFVKGVVESRKLPAPLVDL